MRTEGNLEGKPSVTRTYHFPHSKSKPKQILKLLAPENYSSASMFPAIELYPMQCCPYPEKQFPPPFLSLISMLSVFMSIHLPHFKQCPSILLKRAAFSVVGHGWDPHPPRSRFVDVSLVPEHGLGLRPPQLTFVDVSLVHEGAPRPHCPQPLCSS